jgi:hypothetical protein
MDHVRSDLAKAPARPLVAVRAAQRAPQYRREMADPGAACRTGAPLYAQRLMRSGTHGYCLTAN